MPTIKPKTKREELAEGFNPGLYRVKKEFHSDKNTSAHPHNFVWGIGATVEAQVIKDYSTTTLFLCPDICLIYYKIHIAGCVYFEDTCPIEIFMDHFERINP